MSVNSIKEKIYVFIVAQPEDLVWVKVDGVLYYNDTHIDKREKVCHYKDVYQGDRKQIRKSCIIDARNRILQNL